MIYIIYFVINKKKNNVHRQGLKIKSDKIEDFIL